MSGVWAIRRHQLAEAARKQKKRSKGTNKKVGKCVRVKRDVAAKPAEARKDLGSCSRTRNCCDWKRASDEAKSSSEERATREGRFDSHSSTSDVGGMMIGGWQGM